MAKEEKQKKEKIDLKRLALYGLFGLAVFFFVLQVIAFALGIDGNVLKTCYTALGAIGGAITTLMVVKVGGKTKGKEDK